MSKSIPNLDNKFMYGTYFVAAIIVLFFLFFLIPRFVDLRFSDETIFTADTYNPKTDFDVNDDRLRWAPPEGWEDYEEVTYQEYRSNYFRVTSSNTDNCDIGKNLRIILPNQAIDGPIEIAGGNNIVILGGEINIPFTGDNTREGSRVGIKISDRDCEFDNPRTVYIEGVRIGEYNKRKCVRNSIESNCSDLSDGFHIATRRSDVIIQNVRIEDVHIRQFDEIDGINGHPKIHPDVIQSWGGVQDLMVDKLTGSTDYQGLMLKNDFPVGDFTHGDMYFSRVNINSTNQARYMLWDSNDNRSGSLNFEEVYLEPSSPSRSEDNLLWPKARYTESGSNRKVVFNNSSKPYMYGDLYLVASSSDFVPVGTPGVDYVSPGYQGGGSGTTGGGTTGDDSVLDNLDVRDTIKTSQGNITDNGFGFNNSLGIYQIAGSDPGEAKFDIDVDTDGLYSLYVKHRSETDGKNSVFINVNENPATHHIWDSSVRGSFQVEEVTHRPQNDAGNPNATSQFRFELFESDNNEIIIQGRESEMYINEIYVVLEDEFEVADGGDTTSGGDDSSTVDDGGDSSTDSNNNDGGDTSTDSNDGDDNATDGSDSTDSNTGTDSGDSNSTGSSSTGSSSSSSSGSSGANPTASPIPTTPVNPAIRTGVLSASDPEVATCKDNYLTENETKDSFSDRDLNDNVFYDFITTLHCRGVVGGFSDGEYKTDELVTRYAMSKFIVQAFDIGVDRSDEFNDVPDSNVFSEFANTLKATGISNGDRNGNFNGDDNVTRGQAIAFIVRAMDYKGVNIFVPTGGTNFDDLESDDTFYEEVRFIEEYEISGQKVVNGYSDGTIKLDNRITRGEMAKIIDVATREY